MCTLEGREGREEIIKDGLHAQLDPHACTFLQIVESAFLVQLLKKANLKRITWIARKITWESMLSSLSFNIDLLCLYGYKVFNTVFVQRWP